MGRSAYLRYMRTKHFHRQNGLDDRGCTQGSELLLHSQGNGVGMNKYKLDLLLKDKVLKHIWNIHACTKALTANEDTAQRLSPKYNHP